MKTFFIRSSVLIFLAVLSSILLFQQLENKNPTLAELEKVGAPRVRSSFSPLNRDDALTRHEFEMRRLRDPQTGRIPDNIRARELDFARRLPTRENLQKSGAPRLLAADWTRRGPVNVGGRTRALAIDLNYNGTSNRRILAGGVSGGMFLSTDDGATWQMTTTLAQLPSATCLVQDPANRNIWYYGTGELLGSTPAGFKILRNQIPGQGIFKSTDGGVTWSQLPSTVRGNLTQIDPPFDFVWNLAIRPQSGALFAATLGAIARSTDGGNSWTLPLVGQDANFDLSIFSDVAIAANGDVYATLSRNGIQLNNLQYGVFRSANNGDQFTVITPPNLVADPFRMVLAAAPSDPNTLYLLVQANQAGAVAADHQFFRYNAANNSWTNLSASLPNEAGLEGNATFSSQGGYDLLVKVKPDNPNVVWIGGTNLYRSTNGGQTFTRVGGYLSANTYGQFENHHSDQHALVFFPNNANAMISGNDGGLAKTTNALAQPQTWASLNNGYVATQFYAVALDPQTGSNFITGGTQDNGTWGTAVVNFNTPWASLLSGDGAYTEIVAGGNTFYVSAQMGLVIRARRSNNQLLMSLVKPVTPNGDRDFLFITPYQLDPNNPRVMYLAVGNSVWRNSNLDDITVVDNQDPVTTNWSSLSNSAVSNMQVTTLAVSKTPANRLYFGATNFQTSTAIVRVDNAPGNPAGANITPPGAAGAYPSCIGVNPNNANEIIAVFSNYRIPSLWHSNNGGGSWTNIEGNLAGDEGPSIRWATIVPTNSGRTYLLATSTGIYSTTTLNGANTAWVQEGATPIGNVVVDMIVARPSDGVVVAGTHGRGVYSAQVAGGTAVLNVNVSELNISLRPGTTTSVQFSLGNTGTAPLDYNITATGPAANNGFTARLSDFENDVAPNLPKVDLVAAQAATSGSSPVSAKAVGERPLPSSGFFKNSALDVLVLDDGDDAADTFIGFPPPSTNAFSWLNVFAPAGFGFRLESFSFYMQTESATSNSVSVAVNDANGNILTQGTLAAPLAPAGGWFTIMLTAPISFNDGERFSILVRASNAIRFPAGTDTDAAVTNQSFYFDPGANTFVNLNTIPGFANGAFLIRANGTKAGANRLTVAPASGTVAPNGSQTIKVNFDAQGLAEGSYQGQLSITSNGGNRTLPVRITVSNTVKVDEPRHEVPRAFALEQNYPNPFNPETKIRYRLPASGEIYLRIYNLHGELVTTLVSGAQAADEYVVYWDGRNHLGERVASGVYLYRLEAISNTGAATSLTRKLTLMK